MNLLLALAACATHSPAESWTTWAWGEDMAVVLVESDTIRVVQYGDADKAALFGRYGQIFEAKGWTRTADNSKDGFFWGVYGREGQILNLQISDNPQGVQVHISTK